MEKIVNRYFITHEIYSVSFPDHDKINEVLEDLDDERSVKCLIRYRMLILHLMEPRKVQLIFKDTLRYYLSTNQIDFVELFYSGSPTFELPTMTCRGFFVLIWEVYYGGEDYLIDDISEYVEINDERMLNRVYNEE